VALPALVLVHGGGHAADCWDLTIEEIHRIEPSLTALAVDLPGRRSKPGNLRTLTIAECVDSVVADIENAGLGEVIVVGHSIAGITAPAVAAKLGAPRVRELVLAAAVVPGEGETCRDVMTGSLRLARPQARRGRQNETPFWWVRYLYLNGVPRARRRFVKDKLYAESGSILAERVSGADRSDDIPRTWILTTRNRALSVKAQRRNMEAIGGVQAQVSIDTCHDLMVSEPERLAEILVDRCRLYD
jgi:pimeloyl-ACP methyl ester carboxylesterase